MDTYMDPDQDGTLWCGLLQRSMDSWVGLAHHQMVEVPSLVPNMEDELIMLYNWRLSCTMGSVQLLQESESQMVRLPAHGEEDIYKLMEVCAGVGGISAGLSSLGFVATTAMDINPFMCPLRRSSVSYGSA